MIASLDEAPWYRKPWKNLIRKQYKVRRNVHINEWNKDERDTYKFNISSAEDTTFCEGFWIWSSFRGNEAQRAQAETKLSIYLLDRTGLHSKGDCSRVSLRARHDPRVLGSYCISRSVNTNRANLCLRMSSSRLQHKMNVNARFGVT